MREIPHGLKTLIIRGVHPNLTLFFKNNKLDNIPICLEKLIIVLLSTFTARTIEPDKVEPRINFYEEKDKESILNAKKMLCDLKRPFGCKIYVFIDGRPFYEVID